MKIVHSSFNDLQEIARVHCSAFPDHLSSAMGIRFVIKTLRWYLEHSQNGFLLHLENDGKIVGYVTAFYNDGTLSNGSATTIGQYAFKTAISSFLLKPWLIFHPEVRLKWSLLWKQILLKTKFKKQNKLSHQPHSVSVRKAINKCGLLSIGVSRNMQGKGCGSFLLHGFEQEAIKRFSVSHLELTVKSDNYQAQKAYMKNGWQIDDKRGDYCHMYKDLQNK